MAFNANLNAAGVRRILLRTAPVTFEVWTRRSGASSTIKLMLLDGGLSCTHETFQEFDSVLPHAGSGLPYYDQLGLHHCSQPDPPGLWEIDRFVDEVWSRCAESVFSRPRPLCKCRIWSIYYGNSDRSRTVDQAMKRPSGEKPCEKASPVGSIHCHASSSPDMLPASAKQDDHCRLNKSQA